MFFQNRRNYCRGMIDIIQYCQYWYEQQIFRKQSFCLKLNQFVCLELSLNARSIASFIWWRITRPSISIVPDRTVMALQFSHRSKYLFGSFTIIFVNYSLSILSSSQINRELYMYSIIPFPPDLKDAGGISSMLVNFSFLILVIWWPFTYIS